MVRSISPVVVGMPTAEAVVLLEQACWTIRISYPAVRPPRSPPICGGIGSCWSTTATAVSPLSSSSDGPLLTFVSGFRWDGSPEIGHKPSSSSGVVRPSLDARHRPTASGDCGRHRFFIRSGTGLSCEEYGSSGKVYECNPLASSQGSVRGDGIVQPRGRRRRPITAGAYLTEHDPSGHLYRFSPANVGESVRRDLEAAAGERQRRHVGDDVDVWARPPVVDHGVQRRRGVAVTLSRPSQRTVTDRELVDLASSRRARVRTSWTRG